METADREVTVLVVPGADLPLLKLRVRPRWVLGSLALWTLLTLWTSYALSRYVDYWVTKADNQLLRMRLSRLAVEIAGSREELQKTREADEQLRVLLKLPSRSGGPASEPEGPGSSDPSAGVGAGGPDARDRRNLVQGLLADPSAMQRGAAALRRESRESLASFREIERHLAHRQRLLRATPAGRPAPGWISSRYGRRPSPLAKRWGESSQEFHSGLDIANAPGTPILATADGVVARAGWAGGYGRMVMIRHEGGYSTLFGHAARLLVRQGGAVKRGQAIAVMGTTGRSTGHHLHYEVWRNGRPVNPVAYLAPAPRY